MARGPGGSGTLRAIEESLASHPDFGDSALIRRRLQARYEFALQILGEWLSALPQALRGRRPPVALLIDPVVRLAIEDALHRLQQGPLSSPDELEEVVTQAMAGLDRAGDVLPTQLEEGGGLRAGPGGGIWLVHPRCPGGPLTQ